jgi:putative copper resistance protein D
MMLEAGLVGARFVHFACAIILFGSALFGLYSHPHGSQSMRLARLSPTILFAVALGAGIQ